ncbi:MAG TPA: ribosome biogenesis GTPase Der [Deltaproteobacteria bacterium]|nr:ribosome biogenesis GTPase Der [Deltaproteobacteria bacterium]
MPVVVIVGRPNAGKSTLFNALVGERRSIVGPQRGITRDRIWGRWRISEGVEVDLVDTGGFDTTGEIQLASQVLGQTMTAIEEADLVICLFDARQPPTPDDEELVARLRARGSRTIYVANKVDDPALEAHAAMFCELGIDEPLALSALNRRGLAGLAASVSTALGDEIGQMTSGDENVVRVGILGRPNVGKSLLLNTITQSERALVSPVAGTTRDYVDTTVTRQGRTYTFVDTAGIRRRSRIEDTVEFVSVTKSLRVVTRSDVCLVLIDAVEGLTDQDKRLCSTVLEHGRPFVAVVNKCDLVTADRVREIGGSMKHELSFAADAPVLFVSAHTGRGVERIYPLVDDLHARARTRVPTPRLNRFLAEITARRSPPMAGSKPLRFYYITQVGEAPPRFQVVVNRPDDVPRPYGRFLARSFKKACGLEGVPVELVFVPRGARARRG